MRVECRFSVQDERDNFSDKITIRNIDADFARVHITVEPVHSY